MNAVPADVTLLETQRAFDGVARGYGRSNDDNALLCAMRARARSWIASMAPPGSVLLDLGCGPGSDAVHFARLGYRVTAIDWSARMAAEAARAIESAECSGRAVVHHLGIHQLDALPRSAFDAAYSNLGPLNCVPDLTTAAQAIARRLRSGGLLVASAIGRVCPWEIALYAGRRQWSRATVRFSRGAVAVPLEGETVWTRYFAPREFVRAFEPVGFQLVALRAIGLLTPPPYMQAFAERHPALIRRLEAAEDRIASWPIVRQCGDHFLAALRKV